MQYMNKYKLYLFCKKKMNKKKYKFYLFCKLYLLFSYLYKLYLTYRDVNDGGYLNDDYNSDNSYDSEDSNAEGYYANEYPEEEDSDEGSDGGDENFTHVDKE